MSIAARSHCKPASESRALGLEWWYQFFFAIECAGAQLCSAAPLKSIDHEMLAGHEHMRLDGQIAHDAGDVLRRADPSHGNACG